MHTDKLTIAKDGRLTDGEIDITDRFLALFNNRCELADDLTLRDIFLLVRNVNLYSTLSPILTYSPDWLEGIINEGLDENPSDSKTKSLELHWHSIISDDICSDKDMLDTYSSTHALGGDEPYSIGFTPAYEIIDCPITLNENLKIYDERPKAIKNHKSQLLLETNKSFTLFEILYGIFYEMSFYGSISDRKDAYKSLMDTIDRIDKGEEELIPMDEVFKKIEGALDGEGKE